MERSIQLYTAAMSRRLAYAEQELLESVQKQMCSIIQQQTLANQQTAVQQKRDKEEESKRTLFCGNLDKRVSRHILLREFVPAGPIAKVYIPRCTSGKHRGFAFIVYEHIRSVPLAFELCKGLKLFGKMVNIEPHQTIPCRQQQKYDRQGPHNQATASQEGKNASFLPYMCHDRNSTYYAAGNKQYPFINYQNKPDNNDQDDVKKLTLYFSNLDGSVPDSRLYEIFCKAGPVDSMSVTKDTTGKQRNYGYVTYKYKNTVALALELFADVKLFDINFTFKKDEAGVVK